MFDYLKAKNQTIALDGRKVNSARVRYLAENGFADKGSGQTELRDRLTLNTKAGTLRWGSLPGNAVGACTGSYAIPDFRSGQNLALR